MTDRYEDATESLRGVSPPDQWDEIVARSEDHDIGINSGGNGNGTGDELGRRRRGPRIALAVAASAAAIVGAVILTRDDPPTTVTDDPTATSTPAPETTVPPPDGETTDPLPEEDAEVVCDPASLVATEWPGSDMARTPTAAEPDDPRVPEALRPHLATVFTSGTTTRAVFVLRGHPAEVLGDVTTVDRPTGFAVTFGPYDDGWAAKIEVETTDGEPCPMTLLGVGMNEADLTQFVERLGVTTRAD